MERDAKGNGEENLITKTTLWAMEIVSRYVSEGDTVIDATMGNGCDTVALAKLVGPQGRVLAFDIQPQALENTRELLAKELPGASGAGSERVRLILDTNANLGRYVQQEADDRRETVAENQQSAVAAVLFNLGYLPGGDKNVTTTAEETLRAARSALAVVKPGGLVAAVLYSGHPRGAEEKDALLRWAKTLSPREYHVAYIAMWNQPKHPPEILLITKKKP